VSTNVTAKNFDMVAYVLSSGAESAVNVPETVLRFVALQCTTYADVYLGRTPGQTFVVANRWTIKAGQILVLEDVAISPTTLAGTIFYARGSSDSLVLEVLYASG